MIPLQSEPELKMKESGCTLLLWVCEPFDEQYSFRTLFAKIAAVLKENADFALSLPPEEPAEDFVHGVLRWRSTAYAVYFERSLGYVELSNVSLSSGRELLDALTPEFTWPRATAGQ